jgi:hypothetical protein
MDVSFSLSEGLFREKLDQLVLSKRPRRALAFCFLTTFACVVAVVSGAFYLNASAAELLEQLSFQVQAIEALKKVSETIVWAGTATFLGCVTLVIHSVARWIGGRAE